MLVLLCIKLINGIDYCMLWESIIMTVVIENIVDVIIAIRNVYISCFLDVSIATTAQSYKIPFSFLGFTMLNNLLLDIYRHSYRQLTCTLGRLSTRV